MILRLAEGLDFSKPSEQTEFDDITTSQVDLTNGGGGILHNDSNLSIILQQNVLSQTSLSIPGELGYL